MPHYLKLQAHPICLLPLLPCLLAACLPPDSTAEQKAAVKPVLLSVLGDLEEVWSDTALRNALLQLPLNAMELLLSCDMLKVGGALVVVHAHHVACLAFAGEHRMRFLHSAEVQRAGALGRSAMKRLFKCSLLNICVLRPACCPAAPQHSIR